MRSYTTRVPGSYITHVSNNIIVTRNYKLTYPTIPELQSAITHVSYNTTATVSYNTRVLQYHSYSQLQHTCPTIPQL